MNISIQFKEAEIPVLIEMYLDKVKQKKEEIFHLEKDVKDISAKVSQLRLALKGGNGSIAPLQSDSAYSDKWQWVKKISFAIELNGKPLTINEIIDTLSDYEPSFINDRKKVMSSISGTLSIKSGSYDDRKEFIRCNSESGEYAYDVWKENEPEQQKSIEKFGNEIELDDLPF